MNQDSLQIRMCADAEEWSRCGHLFVVADGMGGHAVGDLASRIAVESLPQAYYKSDASSIESRLREAILAANKAINDRGRENREFEGMGTTCSALSLSIRGAVVGHVGDSRVYRVRRGRIEQLTFDHSLQWEMIRLGRATPENVELFHPRNVITRCLGPDPMVQVDIEGPFSVETGDLFLLCSDGLTNHVSDREIGQIVGSLPPTESSRLLINLANCRGGSDNSTVIVVEVENYPASANGTHIDTDQTPKPITKEINAGRSFAFWTISMAIASFVCLCSAIALAIVNKKEAAASLFIAAVFALLISRRSARKNSAMSKNELELDQDTPLPVSKLNTSEFTEEPLSPLSDAVSSSRAAFLPSAPYRVIESSLSESLLSHLAEVQSDLVQAARDSGWKVDFEELTNLNRQAVQALQIEKLDRAIKARAKAIDLLMREMYQRSRPV